MKNEKVTIGYVVLHYYAYDSTINTIQSILEHDKSAIVIVVDNGSGNGSGKCLAEKYENADNVRIVLLDDNLGFAKGNNVGYKILKNEYHPDYICILNNDVLLTDFNLGEKLNTAFNRYGFGVLGPHILLKNGSDFIFTNKFESAQYYEEVIANQKKTLESLEKMSELAIILRNRYKWAKRTYVQFKRKKKQKTGDTACEDALLHGCCLFFSKLFIDRFDDAFCNDTFLYAEEELLYLKCKRNAIKTLYYPNIVIRHMEDVATNSASKKAKEKEIRRLGYSIDSLGILVDAINNPSALTD